MDTQLVMTWALGLDLGDWALDYTPENVQDYLRKGWVIRSHSITVLAGMLGGRAAGTVAVSVVLDPPGMS